MDLSIIITSYKNPELLKVCLDSVIKSELPFRHEIIVADSDTEEKTEAMMREEYPDVVFFPFSCNVGFQALLKKGIENSKGVFLLLLNGDIVVKPDSIKKMLEYMRSKNDIGVLGPKLLNFNETFQYSCFRFYTPMTIVYRRTVLGKLPFGKKHLDWFLMKDFNHESIRSVDWLMGSALMIPRSALDKIGLMDPRFFMYMEDVDWCRRFWDSGFKVVYFPLATMYHYHGKVSDKGGVFKSLFNKMTWVHIASAIKYFKKYWGKPTPVSDNH